MRTLERVKSFADIDIDGGVPTQPFLAASDGLLEMFDLLGHGVFSFIQADIRSNIQGVRSRVTAHDDATLEAVLVADDARAIGSLVRLIRGYRYICKALGTMQDNPDLPLHQCFKRAYDEVLRHFHSPFVRSLVAVAIRAAPSRSDFYARIGQGTDQSLVDRQLRNWLAGLERIVSHMSPRLPYH